MRTFRLVVSCPDRTGIVAAVASYVAGLGGSLIESSQHTDVSEAWFFLRNEIDLAAADCSIEEFRSGFEPIASEFDMQWYVRDSLSPQKVVILASKASHCLTELLYRWKAGELYCEILRIISNHENLRSLVEWHGIPFHHVPVPKEGKGAAFQKTNDIIERHAPIVSCSLGT